MSGTLPPFPSSWRLRRLSWAVLFVVAALAVGGCLATFSVVHDQEHRLLKQRSDEAALYLSSAVGAVQTELASLAASSAASNEQPAAFVRSTRLLTASPTSGFASVALIRTTPSVHVVAVGGKPLVGGLGSVATSAVRLAAAKQGVTGGLVSSPVLRRGDARALGFAYASPALPGAVVYAESMLTTTKQSPATSSQPFSELVAAVYAGGRVAPDELVVSSDSSGGPPKHGTVTVTAPVGVGAPWVLVTKARHPLVGSIATLTPWAILLGGLLAAALATGIVETLARRREYALKLVDERTEALRDSLDELATAQSQLVRQERLAAIGELASTIGHELRNPLAVISNAVYLLRKDFGPVPTEPALRHLATAEREVSAATVIVADLLEFARARQPVAADIDLVALVDEVLTVQPPPPSVRFVRDLPARAPARGDRDMLRQVLLNLVTNATQAMPDGGELTVGLSADAGVWRLRVTDTGSGIEPETLPHVFEPFFTTKPRGVGLGLAVSKRIVEQHHGDLLVDSTPEVGTTFVLTLPTLVLQRTAPDIETRTEVGG